MERTCKKCGHLNAAADGGYLEACPECGAIYNKVERALKERAAAELAKAVDAEAGKRAVPPLAEKTPLTATAISNSPVWSIVALVIFGVYFFSGGSSKSHNTSSSGPAAVVSNSGWDGSVWQVERHLKANLKDPSSLDVIEWSPVVKGADGGFIVRVKYRAKNSFGGYVIEHQVFSLDAQGNVTGVASM